MNDVVIRRVIPVLLLRGGGLVKSTRFDQPKYVGDPVNTVRIFNEKEVDELILLDTTATTEGRAPNLETIAAIAAECFMPLCYGGGISDMRTVEEILKRGVEKLSFNAALVGNPDLVRQAALTHGSSTIVGSIDFRGGTRGAECFIKGATERTGLPPVDLARRAEDLGVGEILLTSIDRDGMMTGYDLETVRAVSDAVSIPVVANGGAGNLVHMRAAIHEARASAVAGGAFFVFIGKLRAVLITYPTQKDLAETVFAP